MTTLPEEDEQVTLKVIALFTTFLEAYSSSTEVQQRAFLDFINPQTRQDLINLAANISANAKPKPPKA